MGVFGTHERAADAGPEQVVFCQDRRSGLRAIIAIHSTALGPALGGTRFHDYSSEEEALHDALDLSRAMAYKNALAGLDLGGGKAVIWGDPARQKSEPLLRAYGRFVESLGGRYITACDVGTYVADMDVVARETRWVTGRSEEYGGAGDSSVLTAWGLYQGMRAAVEHVWGTPSLAGRRIGVVGVGKVGRRLLGHLREEGAEVVATDVSGPARDWVREHHPAVGLLPDTDAVLAADLDVYAPCALGGALDDRTVSLLTARIVAGAANNQLAHPGVAQRLADRGVWYVPDFVVNAGGVIQVADEIGGFVLARAKLRAGGIYDTTRRLLTEADAEGVSPAVAADRLAERRMTEVGRLRTIRLG